MLTHILILLSIGVILYELDLIPRKRNSKALNFPELHEIDCPILKELYAKICGYMTSDKVVVYEYPTYPKIKIISGSRSIILKRADFTPYVIVLSGSGDVLGMTSYFFKNAVKILEE